MMSAGELSAAGGECIEIRRLHDGMSARTKRVVPMIVGNDENDIGRAAAG